MDVFVIGMTAVQVVAFLIFARLVQSELKKFRNRTPVERREARLIKLYDHVEELMDVFETYIEEVRQDVEKDREGLTELSRQTHALYARIQEERAAAPPLPAPPPEPAPPPREDKPDKPDKPADPKPEGKSRLSARDREALNRFATKPQKVRFLMSRGLPLEDVARELGIGKGEVRLIAELDK